MSIENFNAPEQPKSPPPTKSLLEELKEGHEVTDYLKRRDEEQAKKTAEELDKLNKSYGKFYDPETGERERIPVYEAESIVHRDYDPKSGKASLEIYFNDSEGEHSMILLGKLVTEDDLEHVDIETISGQLDGIKISKEEALAYWKKYFAKEGIIRKKVGERFPGSDEIITEKAT